MKVCYIGDGNSVHVIRMAEWMRAHKHFVQMIDIRATNRECSRHYDSYYALSRLSGFRGFASKILPIRKYVRTTKPDIVHGQYLTGAGVYATVSGAKHTVVSAWGTDVYSDVKDFLKRQCVKYALRHSKVVLADSDHLVNECRKLAPKARIEKVIFGIDTELFKPNPVKHEKFRFLSLRATAPIYNPRTIVEAFLRAHLDAELWMYRPSAESFEVMDIVNGNEYLKSHVVWLDKRPYDQMPELLNSCDCGVSIPSWDSSSTAMMEAMACGIPVIASRIPMNEEWILPFLHSVMGTRITVEDIADRMVECQEYPLKAMGKNARELVMRKADFQTEMTKAERIYTEVLNEK